jgi:hypothetical protein
VIKIVARIEEMVLGEREAIDGEGEAAACLAALTIRS